jgi:hypothetical protein
MYVSLAIMGSSNFVPFFKYFTDFPLIYCIENVRSCFLNLEPYLPKLEHLMFPGQGTGNELSLSSSLSSSIFEACERTLAHELML